MIINKVEKVVDGFIYHFTSATPAAPAEVWVDGKVYIIPVGENTYHYRTQDDLPPPDLRIIEMSILSPYVGILRIQWYHDGEHPLAVIEIYNPANKLVKRDYFATTDHGYYEYVYKTDKTGWYKIDIIPTGDDEIPLYSQAVRHEMYARPIPPIPKFNITLTDENTLRVETT